MYASLVDVTFTAAQIGITLGKKNKTRSFHKICTGNGMHYLSSIDEEKLLHFLGRKWYQRKEENAEWNKRRLLKKHALSLRKQTIIFYCFLGTNFSFLVELCMAMA